MTNGMWSGQKAAVFLVLASVSVACGSHVQTDAGIPGAANASGAGGSAGGATSNGGSNTGGVTSAGGMSVGAAAGTGGSSSGASGSSSGAGGSSSGASGTTSDAGSAGTDAGTGGSLSNAGAGGGTAGSGGTPAAGSGGVGGDASGNGGNGGTTSSGGAGGSAGSSGGSSGGTGGSAGSSGGSNGGTAGSAGSNGGTGGGGGTTYLVTVVKNGTGTVTSRAAGIDCGATCSASFPAGALTLHAHPSNGSGYRFAGWSGACSGLAQDCSLTVGGDLTATATFVPVTQNLVFVTSDVFAPDLGSAAAYDAKCNAAATTAGINNVAGSSYIAYTSDANSLAKDRLKNARGWVRMDGKPFADTQSSLFTKGAVFYPIEFDETGATPSNIRPAMTGAGSDGSLSSQTPTGNCNDFTSADVADYVVAGASDGGPSTWSSIFAVSCNNSSALICMGKDLQVAATPTPETGKYIWLTDAPFVIGGGTPNDFCKSALPAGVTNAVALISSSGSSAASVLNASTRYVRLDGVPIGTGAQIAAGTLESGLWQTGTGHYNDAIVWTGATDFGSAGTTVSTCSNWTAPGSSDNPPFVPVGESGELRTWWYDVTGPCNSGFIYLYCAQTAP